MTVGVLVGFVGVVVGDVVGLFDGICVGFDVISVG